MIGYKVNDVKKRFFTAANVINSVDKTTRRALSMFGAFVRTTAKQSIRKRKDVSKPGDPPNAHLGLIGRFLYFIYDDREREVVIGPALLNSSNSQTGSLGELEHGGDTTITFRKWERVGGQRVLVNKKQTVTLRKRPFMVPAREKNIPALPRIWAKAQR